MAVGIRFASLGSGSKGNATVIAAGKTAVLLDCGFTLKETERRLHRLGVAPESLAAVLVTHEHGDHIGGVGPLARRYDLPVWLTEGTHTAWSGAPVLRVNRFNPHEGFAIGDLQVFPFPVPHDAREPCQYVFGDGACRLGVLSDAGSVTAHMREVLSGCDALTLECNHDPQLLAAGPYPEPLKRRVAGPLGHLSNAQAGALLAALDVSRLKHLLLTHLSAINNTPVLARAAVCEALQCAPEWLDVADQEQGFVWRYL